MMRYIGFLLLSLLPLTAQAETYEQAFVLCSEQVAGQDGDHAAALAACLSARGFEPQEG